MAIAADILGVVLMLGGAFFMLVAAVGFVRLPDLFCRLHVTGILDTLGAPLIMLGAALMVGVSLTAGKVLLGMAFLFLTSPLVGHLLSRAAIESGYEAQAIEGPVPGQDSVISDDDLDGDGVPDVMQNRYGDAYRETVESQEAREKEGESI